MELDLQKRDRDQKNEISEVSARFRMEKQSLDQVILKLKQTNSALSAEAKSFETKLDEERQELSKLNLQLQTASNIAQEATLRVTKAEAISRLAENSRIEQESMVGSMRSMVNDLSIQLEEAAQGASIIHNLVAAHASRHQIERSVSSVSSPVGIIHELREYASHVLNTLSDRLYILEAEMQGQALALQTSNKQNEYLKDQLAHEKKNNQELKSELESGINVSSHENGVLKIGSDQELLISQPKVGGNEALLLVAESLKEEVHTSNNQHQTLSSEHESLKAAHATLHEQYRAKADELEMVMEVLEEQKNRMLLQVETSHKEIESLERAKQNLSSQTETLSKALDGATIRISELQAALTECACQKGLLEELLKEKQTTTQLQSSLGTVASPNQHLSSESLCPQAEAGAATARALAAAEEKQRAFEADAKCKSEELEALRLSNEDKKVWNARLRASLTEHETLLSQASELINALKSEKSHLEHQLEQVSAALHLESTQAASLQQRVVFFQSTLEAKEFVISDMIAKVKGLDTSLEHSTMDLNQTRILLEHARFEINSLTSKYAESQTEIADLQHQRRETEASLLQFRTENERAQAECNRLRGVAEEAREQEALFESLQRSVEVLSQEQAEYENTLNHIRGLLADFAQRHQSFGLAGEQISALRRERGGEAITLIVGLLECASREIFSFLNLQREYAAAVSSVSALQKCASESDQRFKRLQAEGRSSIAREEELMTVLATTRLQLAEARNSYDLLQGEVAVLRDSRQVDELQAQVKELMAVVAAHESSLKTKISEKHASEDEMNKLILEQNTKFNSLNQETLRLREQLKRIDNSNRHMDEVHQMEVEALMTKIRAYELDAAAMTSLAGDFNDLQKEHKLALAECQQKTLALNNLQNVLENFQHERDSTVAARDKEINQLRVAAAEARGSLDRYNEFIALHAQQQHLLQEQQQQLRATQTYVIKLENENTKIRRGLQQTMEEVKKFSSDEKTGTLVDRRLVSSMLVSYFERPNQKGEVLELMARILQFDEKDKTRIGLGRGAGIGGAIRSWASWLSPWDAGVQIYSGPTSPSGEPNLADMWVDFLLKETGDTGGSVRNSRPAFLDSPSPECPSANSSVPSPGIHLYGFHPLLRTLIVLELLIFLGAAPVPISQLQSSDSTSISPST